MRIIFRFILALILCSLASFGFAGAPVKPPAKGGVLPEIILSVPDNSEHQQYLGVTGEKNLHHP